MNKLSINDKTIILWINNIEGNTIVWKDRKVIIFEYFSKFQESFLFEKVNTLWFNFQIKIRKEKLKNCETNLLKTEYIDLQKLDLQNNSKYSIVLDEDKKKELDTININKEQLEVFVEEKNGEKYIYRHYAIIDIPKDKNIETIVYEFISQIRDHNNIIRLLKQEDLKDYLSKELLNEKKGGGDANQTETKLKFYEFFTNPSKVAFSFVQKVDKILQIIEKSFFQQKIENIDSDILEMLSTPTYKWESFIKNWALYKGWLYLKWIPKENFNILQYLFLHLEEWDSITINMYPESKHILKKAELEGVDKYLNKTEEEIGKDMYMQLLINFNDINETILEKRIEQFQLIIWAEFYTQRINSVMSKYFATYIWVWGNQLNLERLYDKERLVNNLFF